MKHSIKVKTTLILLLCFSVIFSACSSGQKKENTTEKIWHRGDYDEFYSDVKNEQIITEAVTDTSEKNVNKEHIRNALIDSFVKDGFDTRIIDETKDSTTFTVYGQGYEYVTEVVVLQEEVYGGKGYETGVYSDVEGYPVDIYEENPEFFETSFLQTAAAVSYYIEETTGNKTDSSDMFDIFCEYAAHEENIFDLETAPGESNGVYMYFTVDGVKCLYVNYIVGIAVACDAGIDAVADTFRIPKKQ